MRRVSPPADDLTAALREINVRSTVFCRSQFTAPWGFRVDDSTSAKFHLILHGEAHLRVAKPAESYDLLAGDVVLLPQGTGHVMGDAPRSRVRALDRILADNPVDPAGRLNYGGGGPGTTVVCGTLGTEPMPERLLSLMPRVLVLGSRTSAMTRWMEPMFELLSGRTLSSSPGDAAVFAKVADVFLTQLLRQYFASNDHLAVPLRLESDGDRAIGDAVRLMRQHPQTPWTVAGLAQTVGMSRSAFTVRFHDVMDEPPMRHLTRLRLSAGAGYLATTDRTIAEIARLAGYDNAASFTKAFKRSYGLPPGAFRSKW